MNQFKFLNSNINSESYHYAGSQLWRGNTLDRIETEAGMIIGDTLHAAYRDFQGNVRTVVANGRVRQVTHYYPYGLPWAETTSPSHKIPNPSLLPSFR